MANSSGPDGARHQTYADLPEAAQRVPRSTLLHTIYFKRISFPLTSRPDELWIVEVDHTGHEAWRPLEEFLFRFCPPVDPQLFQNWATSWREHFDIPARTLRILNIRFYLNQIMRGLVWVALRRGYLIIATSFSPAGDALPTVFHKVILLLLFSNQLILLFPNLGGRLRDLPNLNLNLMDIPTQHQP